MNQPQAPAASFSAPSGPWRLQAAMVLYQLERSLGQRVRDVPADEDGPAPAAHQVVQREQERGNPIDPHDTDSIVAASYLEELIQIAAQRLPDRQRNAMDRLAELFGTLQMYEVRNAIAHPNRPFPECYWHRVAALATDPAVETLRLPGLVEAYRAAAAERILEPPAQWLEAPTWALPNNLPNVFEHALTGLIGRRELALEVRTLIEHPLIPFVAVVGAGGLGKTSLVLEVLDEVVNDRRSTRLFDRVVFVSSKVEVLTPAGPVDVDAPSTVDALSAVVDQETDGALRDHLRGGGERILLCLDNVDTVLTEHADDFRTFYERLPPTWRVIVTSRVPVDGARTVKVGPLDPKGATKLLYRYLQAKGAEPIRDPAVVARTVEACCWVA